MFSTHLTSQTWPKFHLVKWNKICTTISSRGLGVHNLRIFNNTLLGKWLWRSHQERKSFWKNIIKLNYESLLGSWCSNEVRSVHGVVLWKNIRNGCAAFTWYIKFEVGVGVKINFGMAYGMVIQPLRQHFPLFLDFTLNQGTSISELLDHSSGLLSWDFLIKLIMIVKLKLFMILQLIVFLTIW